MDSSIAPCKGPTLHSSEIPAEVFAVGVEIRGFCLPRDYAGSIRTKCPAVRPPQRAPEIKDRSAIPCHCVLRALARRRNSGYQSVVSNKCRLAEIPAG